MDSIYRDILRRYWGYDDFRGIQLDIIRSIGAGRDTLGLMPTGGGKSITFQVPTLAAEGICIVVTPLISLMKDQVENLLRRGIKAAAVYSGLSRDEVLATLENCIFGHYKFLYVSPERLSSDVFLTKVRRMPVCLITVDEAHCISQWGYDFRPSYLCIAAIRGLFPEVPVLALTATATPPVVEDIQEKLHFRSPNVFRMSFVRSNLSYVVRRTDNKQAELLHILSSVPGSAIIYTRSRRNTKDVAQWLSARGIVALHYHAGLSNADRDLRQHTWQEGEARVMVATNAFGMGIDKSDVRLVVHLDMPDSIEAYFQEAGRAGRDGQRAYAVLLYNDADRTKLHRRVADSFPEKAYIREVYEQLAYFFQLAMGDGFQVRYEFDIEAFCRRFRRFPIPVLSALKILTLAGYIHYTDEEENKSRLVFLLGRDDLYRIHESSVETEQLLQLLLRTYGGLFSDYVFIEEDLLAQRLGCSVHRIYELLVGLNFRRILHYIPRKSIPRITYTQRRVEARHLYIGPEVYEQRKKQYEERIGAMLAYAANDSECRSRQLVRYFGETDSEDCRCCDVCMEKKNAKSHQAKAVSLRDALLVLLSDGERHPVSELHVDGFSPEAIGRELRTLVCEGFVYRENDSVRLSGMS